MPEVEYTTSVAAPVERIWSFVEDMNQWCHLMIGYQALEIVDEKRSIWTLRGDLGIMTREVKLQIDITEWIPQERVEFVVTGLTERLDGVGGFTLAPIDTPDGNSDPAAVVGEPEGTSSPGTSSVPPGARAPTPPPTPAPKRVGPLRRLRSMVARAVFRRIRRKAATVSMVSAPAAVAREPAPVPKAPGTEDFQAAEPTEISQLTFRLRVSPLGPMAPMLEVLMAPMLEPAAQDLADGIRAAVES